MELPLILTACRGDRLISREPLEDTQGGGSPSAGRAEGGYLAGTRGSTLQGVCSSPGSSALGRGAPRIAPSLPVERH